MKVVKGLPFLAMGVLTLGLVGATVLTPYASAINQTVTVTVDGGLSIGGDNGSVGKDLASVTARLGANAKEDTNSVNVYAASNDTGFNINIEDADDNTNLVKPADANAHTEEATIPTSANVAAGTAAWGWRAGDDDTKLGAAAYNAVPAKGKAVAIASSNGSGEKNVKLGYGVSTSPTTAKGNYTDTVVLTAVAK